MSIPSITSEEIELLREPGLTHAKSEILCRCSILSYDKNFNALKNAAARNFDHFDAWLLKDKSHINQGFAMWSDEVAVVAFRGTDQKEGWIKNSHAFGAKKNALGGRNHNGFVSIYREQNQRVLDIINTKISDNTRLWICGHSLGGALATALSAELLVAKPDRLTADWYVSTIGAPRFGTKQFVKEYDKRMESRHSFYVNENDIVPHLGPKLIGYRHVGDLFYFNKDGDYIEVSKEDVGLQFQEDSPAADARAQYELLDDEVNRHSETKEEYRRFLESIEGVEPWIFSEEDALAKGELQGDELWLVKAHNSWRYWHNMRRLV